MAAKYLLVALAVTIMAYNTVAENCDCNDEDTKALWDFLNKLSKDLDGLSEEDKDLYSVPPGFLSPLFDCNCLEKSRKKRAITPEVPATPKLESAENHEAIEEKSNVEKQRRLMTSKSIHFGSRHCPEGYARIGYLCVQEEYLDSSIEN